MKARVFAKRLIVPAVLIAAALCVRNGAASLHAVGIASLVFVAGGMLLRKRARNEKAYVDAIRKLAASAYDSTDRGHAEPVATLAEKIAREMGLPRRKVVLIRTAGYLHDIGRHIEGETSDDRWHAATGADLVRHLPILSLTADWILHHHTWHNGVSCLASLAMTNAPIEAAVLALAEHFDTATYKNVECTDLDDAIEDVRRRAGTKFHPAAVKAFLAVMLRESSQDNSAPTF